MSTLNADGTRVGDAFLTTVNVDFYGAWEPRPGRSHHPPAMSPRRMDLWRPPGRPCEPGRATGLWRLPADCRELCPPGDHRRARSPMRLGRRAWGAVCRRDTRAALSATHRRRAARPARGKWRRRGRHGQPGRRHPITRSRYGAAHHSEGSGWAMSYGHAEKIAALAAAMAARSEKPTTAIDPTLYHRDDMRAVLAAHDIAGLYQLLKDTGLTQRDIAALTGQSQSEVSEILTGRRVLSYDLLVRIIEGLAIPRELMGLSWWGPDGTHAGPDSAYRGQVTVASPERVAEMLRRHLIALGPIAAIASNPLAKLAELLENVELPVPSPVRLPSRLSGVHVEKVRDLTRRLGEAGCAYGSDPEVSSAAAAWATRLLSVSGAEPVKQALMIAAAELHIEAGWGAFDAGLYDRAMWHYARAAELATGANDAYCQALALNWAGLATIEHGQPNDGLKLLQYAGVKARSIPQSHELRTAVEAVVLEDSATAYAHLGCPEAADRELDQARELWAPTNLSGDPNQVAACIELDRGRLDAAEPFAVASMRRWEGVSERARIYSGVVLATVHVRAGEPRGLALAHGAITSAARLTSARVRRRLEPLATALETRSGSDVQQLARMARQVAAARV